MRRAADRTGAGGGQKVRSTTIPAPVGGLNARDSFANMPATDATVLENFFPQESSVVKRAGCSYYSDVTGTVESIIEYGGNAASKHFFGVRNGSIYSLYQRDTVGTMSSVVVGGSGPAVQALTSVRFDHINVGTTGGQFLLLCNGVDPMLEYDGTTWSVGSITGITGGTDEISSIALFQERVWLMRKNTFEVWYLPVGAKSGAATVLNLGIFFKLGGALSCVMTVSLDTSSEIADHICFVSTKGEVVVFRGDVADATSWTRVSQVRIGRPIGGGQRCWTNIGSEAAIICTDGVFPISKAILANRSDLRFALSDKIRKLINEAVVYDDNSFGWQLFYHPAGRKLVLNVPQTGTDAIQYVMNTETKAWCKFTGWNASCFGKRGDFMMWGGVNYVLNAEVNSSDPSGADLIGGSSVAVVAKARQASNYLGDRGSIKHFKEVLVTCLLANTHTLQVVAGINADFSTAEPTDFVTLQGVGTSGFTTTGEWVNAPVEGRCGAVFTKVTATTEPSAFAWVATTINYEIGGSR